MYMCAVIKVKQNKTSMSSNVDSDGVHLTSFGIEFQTEENNRSPSVALLCAGLLRRGMVCEQERVFLECGGFFCSIPVT